MFIRDAIVNHYSDKARRALHAHNVPIAMQAARRALDLDPGHELAQYYLALGHYEIGEFEDALRLLTLLISRTESPATRADAWIRIGNVLDALGRLDDAFAAYAEALNVVIDDAHPDEIARIQGDAYCGLGNVEDLRGNQERAKQLYADAVTFDQLNHTAMTNLAKCHIDERKYARAIPLLQEAVKIAPESGEYWRLLGRALAWNGDVQESAIAYDRAARLGHPRQPLDDLGVDEKPQ